MKSIRARMLLLLVLSCLSIFVFQLACSEDTEKILSADRKIPPDTIKPSFLEHFPAVGDTWVSIDDPIWIRFSEDLLASSVDSQSFSIIPEVNAERTVCRTVAACTVWTRLSYSTDYQVTISTAITDIAGNPIDSSIAWSFRTRDIPPPPVIDSFIPVSGSVSTPIRIYGTGFDSLSWLNSVWFGNESTFVSSSSENVISTLVPTTATSGLISVKNQVAFDTSSTLFQILPPPDTILGSYIGSFLYIEHYDTPAPDSFFQYVTVQFYISQVYIMTLDISRQSESERVFCDMAGSFTLNGSGVILDVDDPNWNKIVCDTIRQSDGFYGATILVDSLQMIHYNPRLRRLKQFMLAIP